MRHSTDFIFTKFFKAYLDDLGIFSIVNSFQGQRGPPEEVLKNGWSTVSAIFDVLVLGILIAATVGHIEKASIESCKLQLRVVAVVLVVVAVVPEVVAEVLVFVAVVA